MAGLGQARSLTARLLAASLLASGAAALVTSALQLAFEYQRDLDQLEAGLDLVEQAHVPAIAAAAFDLDEDRLRLDLATALHTQGIVYVAVADEDPGGMAPVSVGAPARPEVRLTRRCPLVFHRPGEPAIRLGTLEVHASLATAREGFLVRAKTIAFANLLLMAAVALAILTVFRRGIMRHLERIAAHLDRQEWGTLGGELQLDGRGEGKRAPDELDYLVATINGMLERLARDKAAEERAALEKSEMQARLQQSQRLETVGTLAGGVAHEFNNVLMPLMTAADMALQDVQAGDGASPEDLEVIVSAGQRASGLVKQMLVFGRKKETKISVLDLRSVVEETWPLLRATSPKSISMVRDLDPAPLYVEADPVQVGQVLLNIVLNGAHAVAEIGGTLRVEALADRLATPPQAVLRVIDDGIGMDEAVKTRMFDPFFSTKGPDKGTGLGMWVVRGIVESHHGTIEVHSAPGRGTTVEIRFPSQAPPAGGAPSTETPVAAAKGPPARVLVVDDDQAVREAVVRLLDRQGHSAEAAEDGPAALELLEQDPHRCDIVLLDYTMPSMSGLEAARRIRRLAPHVPLVMMTGNLPTDEITREAQASVDVLLHKPVDGSLLERTIQALRTAPPQRQ